MKPNLAATITDLSKIVYPVYASPKLDGIRGLVINGQLRSRSLKTIPNNHIHNLFSWPKYEGLDGELISGSPTAHDVYRKTTKACSTIEGTPDITFYAFDYHNRPKDVLSERMFDLMERAFGLNLEPHTFRIISAENSLLAYEEEVLDEGYEGLILRSPDGKYKYGRSTIKDQGMMKLKRFTDGEAIIQEVFEEMENTNEKKTNELGRSARSHEKAGMVGKGRAGGFVARDVLSNVVFSIGSGLDAEDKKWYWENSSKAIGKIIKYKSFKIGVKDKPRHPVYLGGREEWDR